MSQIFCNFQQKKLNDTFNDSGNGSETSQQQYKGVFSFASGSAVEGIEALKEKENNNYEEEEEEIMENSFHLDKNSNIKFGNSIFSHSNSIIF